MIWWMALDGGDMGWERHDGIIGWGGEVKKE